MSINLFSLLCDGDTPVSSSTLGQITKFGGPILYLIVMGFILFGILVWVDSGSLLPRRRSSSATSDSDRPIPPDVATEAKLVSESRDLLRVLQVTKSYDGDNVVDDVSFVVPRETIFALLGPNGAGKTTTFNVIRESLVFDPLESNATHVGRHDGDAKGPD